MIWRRTVVALTFLIVLHGIALLAEFFAPYDYSEQNRTLPYAPPSRAHFIDDQGRLHLRPFVYRWVALPETFAIYQEDHTNAYPIRFLVQGAPYRLGGLYSSTLHLFGVEAPGRVFLLGADHFGRDVFSRLLYGARISLLAGLLATALSLLLGVAFGSVAGFYKKWIDGLLMRAAELFTSLPWLYLLFAVRAFLPLRTSPTHAFMISIALIGLVGWARPARLVRGVILSARERTFVLAARSFGASDFYLLRRHLLPETYGILLTQAGILIPQYILAEVTLSFLGLGVSEPAPSWGNMLAPLQQFPILVSHWWMFSPGFALIAVLLSYQTLADALNARPT